MLPLGDVLRRGLPPPPVDESEAERGANGTSHDSVISAVADMSLDSRCLSLPDRLNRPPHPGQAKNRRVCYLLCIQRFGL